MSRLAELGTLIREESAGQTIWRIEWLSDAPAAPQPEFSLTFVPPLLPLRGLLFSLGLHLCMIITAGYFHWWPFAKYHQTRLPQEQLETVQYQPLVFRKLPSLASSSSAGVGKAANGVSGKPSSRLAPSQAAQRSEEELPKSVVTYAGPQEIISNLPDATNRVQTIRRPDLIAPPKLKFPIRLPSMVMLPPPTLPALHPLPKRQSAGVVLQSARQPILVKPALPIPAAMQNASLTAQQLASVVSAIPQTAPAIARPQPSLSPVSRPGSTDYKAVIVLNAVIVPPEPRIAIPNEELSGSFATLASMPSAVAEGIAAVPRPSNPPAENGSHNLETGSDSGRGASSSIPGRESGSGGRKNGEGIDRIVNGTAGNGTATGGKVGLHGDSGIRAGVRASGFPGITILGGSVGTGDGITAPRARQGYGITIISGGASAGATSDLGVFNRSETVYTVYIPMGDAGGGGDCSLQYALAGSGSAGNGLLSPPLVTKKVPTRAAIDSPLAREGRIFLFGIITASGELRELRSVRPHQSGSQIALDALAQWQFEPAELNGQPIATKVLFGLSIINSATSDLVK